jgi:hypothetical protein
MYWSWSVDVHATADGEGLTDALAVAVEGGLACGLACGLWLGLDVGAKERVGRKLGEAAATPGLLRGPLWLATSAMPSIATTITTHQRIRRPFMP